MLVRRSSGLGLLGLLIFFRSLWNLENTAQAHIHIYIYIYIYIYNPNTKIRYCFASTRPARSSALSWEERDPV